MNVNMLEHHITTLGISCRYYQLTKLFIQAVKYCKANTKFSVFYYGVDQLN